MAELFFTYLRVSFFAGVMILAVLLARPFLRKAPRNITCILWLLVAMRLLLPFQVESPLSLQPRQFSEPARITDLTSQWPRQEHDQVTDMQQQPQEPLTDEQPGYQQPVSNAQKEPQQSVTDQQPQSARNVEPETVFAVIWMSGGALLLVYAAVSLIVLHHRVCDAVLCLDGSWESDQIADAFLLGYFRPRIYLPVGLEQRDRELIIAHERGHQSRGDQWWKLLGLICLSIHWFNPLVWLAFWLLCRDIEAACDEKVIGKLELSQRKEYSLALLNSGKRLSGFLSYPVAFGEVNLKHRIKSVLSYRKPGIWVTLGAVTMATVIAVCFMTNPGGREKETLRVPPVTQPEEATPPVEEVMEPTVPATTPTEPVTSLTEPTEAETAPTEPTEAETAPTEPTTEPTEITTTPTEPKPTAPKPTEPKPTEPPVTPPQEPSVIAEGNWGGRTPWKITSDGVMTISGSRHIDGSSSEEYTWLDYKDCVTKIIITEGITNIPTRAFHEMKQVTEVSLPNTIEKIESYCFWECSRLRSVTIPPKVKEVETGVFLLCTSLQSVKFASDCSLETIGVGAFSKTALTEFHAPASLKSVDKNAFAECDSLEVLDLWECNASVHKEAFLECGGIKHVLLGEGSALSQFGYPWWYRVETAKLYSDFYEIFRERRQLRSVEIGGRVREIPFRAFSDCTALTDVTITAPITSLEQQAFQNCSSLKELKLPDTVKVIDASALAGTGLKEFTVPASVTKLRWGAFKDSALEQITFLGDAPVFIDETAFRGVTAIAYYPADNPTWTQDKLQNYEGNLTWVPMT